MAVAMITQVASTRRDREVGPRNLLMRTRYRDTDSSLVSCVRVCTCRSYSSGQTDSPPLSPPGQFSRSQSVASQ